MKNEPIITLTRTSSLSRANSRPAKKKSDKGLRSEQVRQILSESFMLYRDIRLPEHKLDEL